MIRLQVTAVQGLPPTQALAADFDEFGGDIGRADGNVLVLPDPDKYVSRIHATIVFRAGCYRIVDKGSATPVLVNGKPVGNGRDAVLKTGDELRIAGYTLRVADAVPIRPASEEDARFPAPAEPSLARPSPPQLVRSDTAPSEDEQRRAVPAAEPFRHPERGAGGVFDDLLPPAPRGGRNLGPSELSALDRYGPATAVPRFDSRDRSLFDGLPDGGALDLDPIAGPASGVVPDLDRMFGLGSTPVTPDELGPPFSDSASADLDGVPDPFTLRDRRSSPTTTQRNEPHEIHEPFPLASRAPAPPVTAASPVVAGLGASPGSASPSGAAAGRPPPVSSSLQPQDVIRSWETAPGGGAPGIRTVVVPSPAPTPASAVLHPGASNGPATAARGRPAAAGARPQRAPASSCAPFSREQECRIWP